MPILEEGQLIRVGTRNQEPPSYQALPQYNPAVLAPTYYPAPSISTSTTSTDTRDGTRPDDSTVSLAAYAAPSSPISATGTETGGGLQGTLNKALGGLGGGLGGYLPYIAIAAVGLAALWFFSRRHDQKKESASK